MISLQSLPKLLEHLCKAEAFFEKSPPTPHYNVVQFGCFDAEDEKIFHWKLYESIEKINQKCTGGVEIFEAVVMVR